jgi:hypothetical protein
VSWEPETRKVSEVLSLLLFNLFCPLTKKTKTKNIEQKKKKKKEFSGLEGLIVWPSLT